MTFIFFRRVIEKWGFRIFQRPDWSESNNELVSKCLAVRPCSIYGKHFSLPKHKIVALKFAKPIEDSPAMQQNLKHLYFSRFLLATHKTQKQQKTGPVYPLLLIMKISYFPFLSPFKITMIGIEDAVSQSTTILRFVFIFLCLSVADCCHCYRWHCYSYYCIILMHITLCVVVLIQLLLF